ncbi:MAG TPA: dihydroxyacetone kinase family protein [Candidatus Obscuribacterales bacterium]
MKKLINDPKTVVREMLEGVVALAPGCALLQNENVIVRNPLPPPAERPVAILSGGGSGHEPAHAGFVGPGLLTAAVAGDIFTSPSADAILSAMRAVAGPAGAVLIVKNYTGDRLNFGLAAEMARSQGIPTQVVVVADDVALRHTVPKNRRRGIAGTILVHKIAGAAAASGLALDDVATIAQAAAADLGSMGVALGACTLPTVGRPGFTLGDDEVELGLGIHGEPGVERGKMRTADALVELMLDTINEDLALANGKRVALLVNGLGATPPIELSIVTRAALAILARRGIAVERAWTGTFLSALDMPGCSLSLLRLDDQRLALLDAEAQAPAWPGRGILNTAPAIAPGPEMYQHAAEELRSRLSEESKLVRRLALAAAQALIDAERTLTDLDTRAGDGDLGTNMARGAAAVRNLPETGWESPSSALAAMGDALRRAIGGSSGPFYGAALLRASRRLAEETSPTPRAWADSLMLAAQAVAELGGAVPGDRTMLDALFSAAKAASTAVSAGHSAEAALTACAAAAEEGAKATAAMQPKLGRASYLGDRALGVPDGGAVAVAVWLKALATELAAKENDKPQTEKI